MRKTATKAAPDIQADSSNIGFVFPAGTFNLSYSVTGEDGTFSAIKEGIAGPETVNVSGFPKFAVFRIEETSSAEFEVETLS